MVVNAPWVTVPLLFISCLAQANWQEPDENDPTLTADKLMRLCDKSFYYRPDRVLFWCEKAAEAGFAQALLNIGYHTKDGSRYIEELNKRIKAGDSVALLSLAWLYESGTFVLRNESRSLALYNDYLEGIDPSQPWYGQTHLDLAKIYQKQNNWSLTLKHASVAAKYINDSKKREYAASIIEAAKAKIHSQKDIN
ncbi:hypothetical protein W04_2125 [Pseudoalteromonas sp. SW0106-04]|uniref:hypothetical protein n=1 Tax=Pseudoalteromonas sp. SW0106-04 TaxID=1702169 RepID=UPI0006B54F09|nr:hypothetical protein [Pseudoalteromonas sp. SW0106-04]GAP75594.1 hypothetical protein W04_2125 [Pseudoalteromonas sp. SW0106-04]